MTTTIKDCNFEVKTASDPTTAEALLVLCESIRNLSEAFQGEKYIVNSMLSIKQDAIKKSTIKKRAKKGGKK